MGCSTHHFENNGIFSGDSVQARTDPLTGLIYRAVGPRLEGEGKSDHRRRRWHMRRYCSYLDASDSDPVPAAGSAQTRQRSRRWLSAIGWWPEECLMGTAPAQRPPSRVGRSDRRPLSDRYLLSHRLNMATKPESALGHSLRPSGRTRPVWGGPDGAPGIRAYISYSCSPTLLGRDGRRGIQQCTTRRSRSTPELRGGIESAKAAPRDTTDG